MGSIIGHKIDYNDSNHNYNKIVKSDWLSTALISALIGQFDRTVRVMLWSGKREDREWGWGEHRVLSAGKM